ncbi:hypothetical protein HRG_007555 [Hirsutella rhossiliensis]|uniref:Terpene synthase n=1 Tax=Hirsutella rhossiliensis TaxID=111463 RepID=A0A9P8MUV7_9HYPO|nr:uncharacterized protein HRG_07555 [Hirsutella rhossiliensis]KAH0961477.1 hypothetical protein HRG_07555 [Hirsutella rhossiliensis]
MAANDELADIEYTAPVLPTQFSSRRHFAYVQLFEYSEKSCARWLYKLAATQEVSRRGAFAACGGSYVAHIYPDGDLERLKIVADMFSAGVFIDDLIDNTTDTAIVSDLVSKYRAIVAGSPIGDARFDSMLRLYTNPCWNREALHILRAEANRYLESTLVLRAIEAEQRKVSVEEYLESRATNVYMGVEYCIIAFAVPALAESLVQISTSRPQVFRRALIYSGTCMGLLADLYKINGEHSEICEYTNIVKILQRQSQVPLSLPHAMDQVVRIFHEYEKRLAAVLEQIALLSPILAKAMEHVHAGTVVWLGTMRGDRYARRMSAASSTQESHTFTTAPNCMGVD